MPTLNGDIGYCRCAVPQIYLDIEEFGGEPQKYCLVCDMRILEPAKLAILTAFLTVAALFGYAVGLLYSTI